MRFMMMVKANKDWEAGLPPDPRLLAALGKHVEESAKAGILISNGGLLPSSAGARIRAAEGKVAVTDGPFAETKELIAGYAIVEAKSKAEAIDLAKAFIKIHVDVLGPSYEGECEVRPMFDPGECGSREH